VMPWVLSLRALEGAPDDPINAAATTATSAKAAWSVAHGALVMPFDVNDPINFRYVCCECVCARVRTITFHT
jgi:hypothetical protein